MLAILLSGGLAVTGSLLGTRVAIGWFSRHGSGLPQRSDLFVNPGRIEYTVCQIYPVQFACKTA